MTTKIPYMITSDKLVITIDQQYYNISRDDSRFVKLKEAIKSDDVDLIRSLVSPKKQWRRPKNSKEFFEGSTLTQLENGVVVDSNGEMLPEDLTKRMSGMMEEGFDALPLERFWNNLRQNPSERAKQLLWNFLAHQGHALTEDGCFIGYRGVRTDFKDKHTGTFDNSPGSVCKMDRDKCDPNPNNTCSKGLHVGSYDYASGFGPVVVEVKVNPMNVVSVPVDYNGQKMRVCEFQVLNVCKSRVDTEMYESSERGGSVYQVPWVDEEDLIDLEREEFLDDVEWWATCFADRYTDPAFLAVRIAEEMEDLTPADVLGMLGEIKERNARQDAKPETQPCVCNARNAKGQFVTGNPNQKRDPITGRFLKS